MKKPKKVDNEWENQSNYPSSKKIKAIGQEVKEDVPEFAPKLKKKKAKFALKVKKA